MTDFDFLQSAPGSTPTPASAREADLLVALRQVCDFQAEHYGDAIDTHVGLIALTAHLRPLLDGGVKIGRGYRGCPPPGSGFDEYGYPWPGRGEFVKAAAHADTTSTPTAANAGGQDAAVAAIEFAMTQDSEGDGMGFLQYWNEGEFDKCRKWWPEAPEAVYIGADPLHPQTRTPTATSAAGLDEAAAYRFWRDCMLAEDQWFMDAICGKLPGDCVSNRVPTVAEWDAAVLAVMQDTPAAKGAAGLNGGEA